MGITDPWRQCLGTTKKGERCGQMVPWYRGDYCRWHSDQAPTVRKADEVSNKVLVSTSVNGTVAILTIAGMCVFFWFMMISYNLVIENDAEKHRAFDDDWYQEYVVDWKGSGLAGESYYERCLGDNPHYENYGDAMGELCFCCFFGFFVFPFFADL